MTIHWLDNQVFFPTQHGAVLSSYWVPVDHFWRVNLPEHQANHSPPSYVEVQNVGFPPLTHPHVFAVWCSITGKLLNSNVRLCSWVSCISARVQTQRVCVHGFNTGIWISADAQELCITNLFLPKFPIKRSKTLLVFSLHFSSAYN